MDFEEWLKVGIDNRWCGPPICETHDGFPSTESEDFEFLEGNDPCMHMIRLYEYPEMKEEIEQNHSPSEWRRTNRGL